MSIYNPLGYISTPFQVDHQIDPASPLCAMVEEQLQDLRIRMQSAS
jgi:hypothetical protein